jgi:hypothetical protein
VSTHFCVDESLTFSRSRTPKQSAMFASSSDRGGVFEDEGSNPVGFTRQGNSYSGAH